jgi:hypothetical protein
MIISLYTFAPGSFVVAEEWNSNFRTLYNTNLAHIEAITDANSTIAFPNSDLTSLFSAVSSQPNSFAIPGSSINISPECEYYKTLGSGEDLVINIPTGFNAECRILIQIQENRSLLPFSVSYAGTTIINYGFYNYNSFRSGYYYIMIYESNGIAQVKLIWTGV